MGGCDKVRKGARAHMYLLVPLGGVTAASLALYLFGALVLPAGEYLPMPWFLAFLGDEIVPPFSLQFVYNLLFIAVVVIVVWRAADFLLAEAALARQRSIGGGKRPVGPTEARAGLLAYVTGTAAGEKASSREEEEKRSRDAEMELLAEEEAEAAAAAAKKGGKGAGGKGGKKA